MKKLALVLMGGLAMIGSGLMAVENDRPERVVAAPPAVGEIPETPVHLIERPGLYGLGTAPPGSRYAIVGASLVRLDTVSNVVRAVIRSPVQRQD